ncbi:DUF4438 domain-containing protein [Thermotalea metallivorans]|uniref:DUF4438 domain-containing protein n=1 Tax=Thermotalea metallivorans TaxID=520762 RepID=A0A140L0Q2_9FIRM|nr:DUF4438 domain-containing protein [Thermotalea metallivorans]KXG74127.1 hypothetical protein AN619_26420 [Thermotalea metallivorans]
MVKTNRDKLIMQSIQGQIAHPTSIYPYRLKHDGTSHILPATGGITYNVQVGDPAIGWAGDHIEPGVSIKAKDEKANGALNLLACIGNEAKVVSGDAKGAKGFVTGIHGGIEHVMIYFKQEDLEKMSIDDQILIKAYGQGLAITDMPEIVLMNLDPDLLEKMNVKIAPDGYLEVPVVTEVPAYLMGSGLGAVTAAKGDYDIMTADPEANAKFGLDQLRFGDIVLLRDCDNTYGRGYLKGAVSIGVIIHSDCIKMGHGPGVTTIMSCKTTKIRGIKDPKANIARYMGVKG